MTRPVRFAHFGVGKMGSMIVQFALDKGGELVAAFGGSQRTVGRDAGTLIGQEPLGIIVSPADQAETILAQVKPDICTVSTTGTLEQMAPTLRACIRAGANCVVIGEEAAWPWTTAADLAARLDREAKAAGVTISASGYPDTYWQTLPLVLAGAMERITAIRGVVSYNVEQYGPHFITGHGVGLDSEAFAARFEGEQNPAGYGEQCMPGDPNGWLCHALGLTVTGQEMQNLPRYSDKAVWCQSLGRDILPGQVLGTANLVTTATAEGITVEMEVCGKIYAPGEQDALTWTLSGTPDTTLTVAAPNTPVITALAAVNRIPQVIAAPAGYVTTDQLPPNAYLARGLVIDA